MNGRDMKRLSDENAQDVVNHMTRACETLQMVRRYIRKVPKWARPAWMKLMMKRVCERIDELSMWGCHP